MSIFMKFGNLKGESTDAEHSGWMDIDECHFHGVKRRVSSKTGTTFDRESSVAELQEVTLVRPMDRASPGLFLASCCGRGTELTLHFSKTTSSGTGSDVFLEYVLNDAFIAAYKVHASICSAQRPSERLTISFAGMQLRYVGYDDSGVASAPIAVSFSPATNSTA